MRKLKIGFSSNKKLSSLIIRKLTGSSVSHCYVRIPVPEMGTSVVFHAQGFNLHYIQYDYFLSHGNKVVEEVDIELTEEEWAKAEMFRVYECGKKYSYSQLMGYGWVLLGKALGRKWSNPFADGSHGYVCVEVVCQMLGISDGESMTPQELLEHLTSGHGKV